MSQYSTPPLAPVAIRFDPEALTLEPAGPVLVRRMSDLEGIFADVEAWRAAVADGDPIVYTVAASRVPEMDRELPQSITTIEPGTVGGEFWMTKGHQHPDPQAEIYLALKGEGLLLMHNGEQSACLEMAPNTIGYIPPGWAHRSINVGESPYSFLAVYPGGAGHDYGWVLENGMGKRVRASEGGAGHHLVEYYAEA